jgi:hypothetical protein
VYPLLYIIVVPKIPDPIIPSLSDGTDTVFPIIYKYKYKYKYINIFIYIYISKKNEYNKFKRIHIYTYIYIFK